MKSAPLDLQHRDHLAHRYRLVHLASHLGEHTTDDRFDFHRGFIGLNLHERLATFDLLARLDQPSHDTDFGVGGCQIGHFHFETHVMFAS